MRQRVISVALILATWAGATPAQAASAEPDAIVVTGKREQQAEVAANQATAITLRPSADNPLARHYAPICVKLFGVDPAYGEVIGERVVSNARSLDLPAGKKGCKPNIWIGFVRNSKAEVERLRKEEPVMFAELKPFEIERIFGGSGAVQAWHATEQRSGDGRPMAISEFDVPGPFALARKVETKVNQQYQSGRLVSPIRTDINGTIVVFDAIRANGRTVQQLADYATMRILAPVQDFDKAPEGGAPTILQLFAEGAAPVDGLTEFDWAYLSAFYKLDRGAKASAVHDATKKAMLDGTGQRLREKSDAP